MDSPAAFFLNQQMGIQHAFALSVSLALLITACGNDNAGRRHHSAFNYGAKLNNLSCRNEFHPQGKMISADQLLARKRRLIYKGAIIYAETQSVAGEALTSAAAAVKHDFEAQYLCRDVSATPNAGYISNATIPLIASDGQFGISEAMDVFVPVMGEELGRWSPSVRRKGVEQKTLKEYLDSHRSDRWSGTALFQSGNRLWLTSHKIFSFGEVMRYDYSTVIYEIQDL